MIANNILITIFNKLLDLNSGSKNELRKYNGKSFILNIIGLKLKARINEDGLLNSCDDLNDDEVVTTIIIPVSIAPFLIIQDKLELFRQIKIIGDSSFAANFLEILSKLNFAGIYAKVSPMSGVLLKQLENILITIKDYFMHISNNISLSLSEYMLYESGDIVNKHKIEQFCTSVDELKARTTLLEKKIKASIR